VNPHAHKPYVTAHSQFPNLRNVFRTNAKLGTKTPTVCEDKSKHTTRFVKLGTQNAMICEARNRISYNLEI
jgi:hypothetical protein